MSRPPAPLLLPEPLNYGALPTTPKGALTAQSKRDVEAYEATLRAYYDNERMRRAQLAKAEKLADKLDRDFWEEDPNPTNDRERRMHDAAYAAGRREGIAEALEERAGTELDLIAYWQHRLAVLGLDTNMGALDVLDAIALRLMNTED